MMAKGRGPSRELGQKSERYAAVKGLEFSYECRERRPCSFPL